MLHDRSNPARVISPIKPVIADRSCATPIDVNISPIKPVDVVTPSFESMEFYSTTASPSSVDNRKEISPVKPIIIKSMEFKNRNAVNPDIFDDNSLMISPVKPVQRLIVPTAIKKEKLKSKRKLAIFEMILPMRLYSTLFGGGAKYQSEQIDMQAFKQAMASIDNFNPDQPSCWKELARALFSTRLTKAQSTKIVKSLRHFWKLNHNEIALTDNFTHRSNPNKENSQPPVCEQKNEEGSLSNGERRLDRQAVVLFTGNP